MIYYVPEWFLKLIAALFTLGFWYQSITLLSANVALNEPTRGFCAFAYDAWALLVLTYGGFYFTAVSLGVAPFSDPFLAFFFVTTFAAGLALLPLLLNCLFK